MNFDRDLREALRPESPPPGFAARVMERIAQEETRIDDVSAVRPGYPRWRAAAASALLAVLLGGYSAHRVAEHRRIEGERARDQVLLAMRITGEKIRYAQQEVRAIGTVDSND